jgi:long-chain acyl-CoA synthetase
MREYFNRPDATASALDRGWLRTGDLGRLDREGRVYITGRKKEVIVLSSGKNLYPEEIEAHYRQSAFIKELCVLGVSEPGVPSAERLHAVVVPDEDVLRARGIVNLKELIRFEIEGLAVQLPAHKRILSYDISTEPLPRTTTGKLKRTDVERRRQATVAPVAVGRTESLEDAAWHNDQTRRPLVETLCERLDRATVHPDDNLELDLHLDSMERVELLARLEQRQGTQVPPEIRATIFTVRHLVDAVLAAPATRAARIDTRPNGQQEEWATLLATSPDPAIAGSLARPALRRAVIFWILLRLVAVLMRVSWRVDIRGREHLPAQGPYLITPNHQAYLDGFLLATALPFGVLRQLFFVGASEYFETTTTRLLARAANIVPVDPDANLVNAMQAAATGLRLGKVLMLFPEGERTIDGALKPFRKGAAILASHLDVPIVPVALDGLYEVWPRGRAVNWRLLLPWTRHRVTLTFGPPLRTGPVPYAVGTDRIREAVAGLLGRRI